MDCLLTSGWWRKECREWGGRCWCSLLSEWTWSCSPCHLQWPLQTSPAAYNRMYTIIKIFTDIGYHNIRAIFSTLRVGCSYHAPLIERSWLEWMHVHYTTLRPQGILCTLLYTAATGYPVCLTGHCGHRVSCALYYTLRPQSIIRGVKPALHWVPGLARILVSRKHLVPSWFAIIGKKMFWDTTHTYTSHTKIKKNINKYTKITVYNITYTGLETGDVMRPKSVTTNHSSGHVLQNYLISMTC